MEHSTKDLDAALPQVAMATGLVRIGRGNQHRWIWPVHLPGWMALGWQLRHPGSSASSDLAAEQALPVALAGGISVAGGQPPDAAPASAPTSGRPRGRKVKSADAAAPAAWPEPDASPAPADAQDGAQPSSAQAPEPSAAAAGDAAPVLPDDLLGEPF